MSFLGRQITGDLRGCNSTLLNDAGELERLMVQSAREAGATVLHAIFHRFAPHGVSGVVVIQESHLAVHTWPELGYAAVDFFTCGPQVEPQKALDYLALHLSATEINIKTEFRGEGTTLLAPNGNKTEAALSYERHFWFTQRNGDLAFSLRSRTTPLLSFSSPAQKIEVLDTVAFGKMLVLNGQAACTERDEFGNHEMAAHVSLQLNPSVESVLILGGGDCGVAREVLRYPQVKEVTLVELDPHVTAIAAQFFPWVHSSVCDPRLQQVIASAEEFIKSAHGNYDLVVVDFLPDEGYSPEFLSQIKTKMNKNGLLVTSAGSAFFNPAMLQAHFGQLRSHFGTPAVKAFHSWIPTYPGGWWCFALAANGAFPVLTNESSFLPSPLLYYSREVHQSAFVLPPFLQKLTGVQ